MKVVIHADASPEMGTGHAVRCLSLAAALRADRADVALASDQLVAPVADSAARIGVAVVKRRDAPRRPSWVVADGYHLDAAARRELADPDVPRLVIDDLGGEIAAAVVLNQNLYASAAGPTHAPTGELLAGPAFALLGPDFADAAPARAQPPVASRILVTMGGSDPHDATTAVIGALAGLERPMEVRVIIGAAHPAPDRAEREAATAGFTLERDVPTLAPQLAWADIVVSACGTTVLEAVRLGRPVVGVILADNQVAVAGALEREGLGRVIGRHPDLDGDRLRAAVAAVGTDLDARRTIAARGPELVDGAGARRVARVMATGPLRLRAATTADADLLLGWRNDPLSRASSFDTSVVEPETHRRWLQERLESDQDRLWIGVLEGRPAGVIRFALDDDAATASVTVAPEQRGRGIATRLILNGCARLAADASVTAIDAWIRPENAASISAFRAAGFRAAAGEPDRLRFRLSLVSVP